MAAIVDEGWLKQPVWYKLYKTELVRDIPFPVGKYHEDVFWSYRAVARAKKVSVFDNPCYFYVQRGSSIMGEAYSLKRLDAMVGYCKTETCLRGYILEYFGQNHPEICGNCGTCTGDFEKVDITREAQMFLSCVKRIYDKLGYGVGVTIVSLTLRGSKDKRVLELGLDELSTYGLMKDKGATYIRDVAAKLEAEGYLLTDAEHQMLQLQPKASDVLYRGQQVQMLVQREEEIVPSKTAAAVKLSAGEADLYEALRQLRARLAEEANVPAYVVFSNATLQDMAKKKPTNTTEFKRVSGVGELKCNWYGKAFLEEIRKHLHELSMS
jgi:ATP-dependent DNA helicase RecQ